MRGGGKMPVGDLLVDRATGNACLRNDVAKGKRVHREVPKEKRNHRGMPCRPVEGCTSPSGGVRPFRPYERGGEPVSFADDYRCPDGPTFYSLFTSLLLLGVVYGTRQPSTRNILRGDAVSNSGTSASA